MDDWVAKEVSKEKMSAEEGKSVAGRIKFGALKEISEELGQMNFIIEGTWLRKVHALIFGPP